jgi:DNA recombination protein RmuC
MSEINVVYLLLAVMLLLVVCLILLVVLIVKSKHGKTELAHVVYQQSDLVMGTHLEKSQARISSLKDGLSKALMMIYRHNQKAQVQISKDIVNQAKEDRMEQGSVFNSFREDMNSQLKEIRSVVDEKLQKTLDQRLGKTSDMISDRLEIMHKGLGKLHSLASGVDDLKNVLSNVKTRGVLGEYLLGNILSDILTPDQYATNVATKKGSQANVEFAVRLPGQSLKEVWLPIDSKFPIDAYQQILTANDSGDKSQILQAKKSFTKAIEVFAKDISSKYIDPPHTTNFALMFLPNEGMYAEVLNSKDLFNKIMTKYKITITGPTTVSAFLNSLQIGFNTLSIKKRSSEIIDSFTALKSEFETYSGLIVKAHKQVGSAYTSLGELDGVRLRAMMKRFDSLETLKQQDYLKDSL